MAEEYNKSHDREYEGKAGDYEEGSGARAAEGGEIKDRGLFDFLGKKEEEKPQEEVIVTEFEKVKVSDHEAPRPHHHEPESYKVEQEEEKEKKHGSLLEKLHRSDSSSSSVSFFTRSLTNIIYVCICLQDVPFHVAFHDLADDLLLHMPRNVYLKTTN